MKHNRKVVGKHVIVAVPADLQMATTYKARIQGITLRDGEPVIEWAIWLGKSKKSTEAGDDKA